MQPSHSRSKFSSCEYVFSIHLTSVQSQIEVQQIVHVKQHVAFTHFATNKCECCVRKNNNGPSARQLSRTRCAIVSPFLSISEWPRWNGKYLFFSIFPFIHSLSWAAPPSCKWILSVCAHNSQYIDLFTNKFTWLSRTVCFIHPFIGENEKLCKQESAARKVDPNTHTYRNLNRSKLVGLHHKCRDAASLFAYFIIRFFLFISFATNEIKTNFIESREECALPGENKQREYPERCRCFSCFVFSVCNDSSTRIRFPFFSSVLSPNL